MTTRWDYGATKYESYVHFRRKGQLVEQLVSGTHATPLDAAQFATQQHIRLAYTKYAIRSSFVRRTFDREIAWERDRHHPLGRYWQGKTFMTPVCSCQGTSVRLSTEEQLNHASQCGMFPVEMALYITKFPGFLRTSANTVYGAVNTWIDHTINSQAPFDRKFLYYAQRALTLMSDNMYSIELNEVDKYKPPTRT